ncbi:hypothetical protein [Bacteroides caecigallinarum]|uniref:hypothetical protein n=1 Tax=Bacteroides caecigallinarum TaxID=1411144 RepID=UPI001F2F818C|nr:hypothetical protein [Bacteroides caecigallinarum]MCF2582243.1 hypothetical protein [Bacteroides caecigallinarum]
MSEEFKDKKEALKSEISRLESDIHFYEDYKLELLKDLGDIQKKIKYLEHKKEYLNQDYLKSLATYNELSNDIQKLTNDINIMDYGIYRPIYNWEDSEIYKKELERVIDLQKEMIKNNTAAICDTTWTICKSGLNYINVRPLNSYAFFPYPSPDSAAIDICAD